MGDYILVSTKGDKLIIASESLPYDTDKIKLGKFVFKNQDGIFAYERSFVTREEFEKFKKALLEQLDKLEKEYKKKYKW